MPRRPEVSPKRADAALGVLLAVTILMRASQNMAQTTMPLVAEELLHLHASVVGLLAAGAGAVSVVVMVIVAARVRTHGALHALFVSMLVMAAALSILGEATSFGTLVVGVVVLGVAGGLAFPTLITAAGQVRGAAQAGRDRPIALLGVALSVSLAMGPFVESGLLSVGHGNLRRVFLWFALLPVAAAAVTAWILVRSRRGVPRGEGPASLGTPRRSASGEMLTGELAVVDVEGADPAVGHAVVGTGRLTLRGALGEARFRVALFGQLVYAAPFAAIVVFGALFARHDFAMTPARTQLAFGAFFAVSFAVRSLLAWRSPIRHKLALFRLATGLTLLGTLGLAAGHGQPLLFAAMVLLGVPHGLTFPLAMSLVAENRPDRQLASVNAHLSASVQAVNLALPLLMGVGIDALGYRPVLFLLLAPIAAAGVFQQLSAARLRSERMPGTTTQTDQRATSKKSLLSKIVDPALRRSGSTARRRTR